MKRHTPANPSALVRTLGPDPLLVNIGATSWPADLSSGFTIRRARPGRDPIGEPASCSVTVASEQLPSWRRGQQFSVELSDTALDRIFGAQSELYTNYVPNPALNYGTAAATDGWTNLAGGTRAKVVDATGSRSDTGDYCLAVTCAADLDGVRTNPTAEVAGSEVIGPDQWLQAAVWVKAAVGEQVRVSLEHGYSALDLSAIDLIDELTMVGDGTWRQLRLVGQTARVRNNTPLLRFQSKSGAQTFYVDAAMVTVADPSVVELWYFDGSSPNGDNDPAGQFYGYNVTHQWTGTADLSWSTRFIDKLPAIEQARFRFTGRLSDLRLRSRRNGLSLVELIGVGSLARLGGIDVGDEPWPTEGVDARAARILQLAQAKGGPAYTVQTSSGSSVEGKDVDRRSATDLLTDLARSAGPTHGLTELRDGSLLWSAGYADSGPAVAVPASLVPAELDHEQLDVINDVTVVWGPAKLPVGFEVERNLCTDPSFEAATTQWSQFGSTLTFDTVVKRQGNKSAKIACPNAGASLMVYQVINYPTTPLTLSAYVRAPGPLTGTWRLAIQAINSSGAQVGIYTTAIPAQVPDWTRFSVTAMTLPATTAYVRIGLRREAGGTTGAADVVWLDTVMMSYTHEAVDYFNGNYAADGNRYTHAWVGAVDSSASVKLAGSEAPRLSIRAVDTASVAANGRASTTLDTQLASTSNRYGEVYQRGLDEHLPGGWQLPPLTFDLLQLLDGRADQAFAPTSQGATRPTELAAQLARVELGSYLTIDGPAYYAGDPFDVSHLPASSIDAPGRVTTLNESITAARWSITTEQERTL